ncbi:YerC/YecD family TrpR-related protein [Christensenellaceae bacterium OttesenSCG-928-K19]|nr:YerC/YecD family TrpR-related protein [Christensenellaceae bacterium OttesenSCG-928-K19]
MEQSKLKSKELDALFEGIMTLKTEQECYQFFEDLCTVNELNAIAQRFKVANMLNGKKTTHAIAEETGASTATISRVNRCLHYGMGGYGIVIERLKK